MKRAYEVTLLFLLSSVAATADSRADVDRTGLQLITCADTTSASGTTGVADTTSTPLRLELLLTDAGAPGDNGSTVAAEAAGPPPAAIGRDLSPAEARQLLEGVPPPPGESAAAFAFPERSLPAPRTGSVVQESFPPAGDGAYRPDAAGAEALPGGRGVPGSQAALTVLRHAPEGEIDFAAQLLVVFSEAMIPLGSDLSTAAPAEVPVRLDPLPAGEWRWIDPRTLLFQPEPRFPMATRYRARVPAGVQAVSGARLERELSWSFQTPPPEVLFFRPEGGAVGRTPICVACFDQQVDPSALLRSIELRDLAGERPVRLANEEEISADPDAARWVADARPGRWIAFRSSDALARATSYEVIFRRGMTSAEGPLATTEDQRFSFATYARLSLVRGPDDRGPCRPLEPWTFEFNNPLDESLEPGDLISVSPPIEEMEVTIRGSRLTIQGLTRARTTYEVTISADLRDGFGQTLERALIVPVSVGDPHPQIALDTREFAVLDPAGPRALMVRSIGYPALRVRLKSVTPSDWVLFQDRWAREEGICGREVRIDTLIVPGEGIEPTQHLISLAPALGEGPGMVVVEVAGLFSEKPAEGDRARTGPEVGTGPDGRADPIEHRPVRVRSRNRPRDPLEKLRFRTSSVWLQSSRIGLSAFFDADSVDVWATDLMTGAPLAGVQVYLVGVGPRASTNADGLARLPLPRQGADLLVALRGDEEVIFPRQSWQAHSRNELLIWYTLDDRSLYRPGETVHLKGWVRIQTRGPAGGITPPGGALSAIRYEVRDPRENLITQGRAALDAFGGFHLEFALSRSVNLGQAVVRLSALGEGDERPVSHSRDHAFRIDDFRRPEYEVDSRVGEGPFLAGGEARVTAEAGYFAGGPLAHTEVTWKVTASPGAFSPPGWREFTFGGWRAPWEVRAARGSDPEPERNAAEHTGWLDRDGIHDLRIAFPSGPPHATSVTAEATVHDMNHQAWSHASVLLVHAADLYVGLRQARYFVPEGEPLRLDVIVTDLDGKPVAEREVELIAERRAEKWIAGEWRSVAARRYACRFLSAAEPRRCVITPDKGGVWEITARVRDARGRCNQTTLRRWVAGGLDLRPRPSERRDETVALIPERDEWAPGDTARILIQAPFSPAEAVIRICRDGCQEIRRVRMEEPTYTVEVPLREEQTPGLELRVDLVGAKAREGRDGLPDPALPLRPAFASGRIDLPIPPGRRTLTVEVEPEQETLAPGDSTPVTVTVRDADGRPVEGVQVLLMAVDEAVLALTGYEIPDPVGALYQRLDGGTASADLRRLVHLDRWELLEALKGWGELHLRGGREGEIELRATGVSHTLSGTEFKAYGSTWGTVKTLRSSELGCEVHPAGCLDGPAGAGVFGEDADAPRLRTDFDPLACFEPQAETGPDGQARILVTLPDNLTRYRLTAVAFDASRRCGHGESAITARLPLMARLSPPRFLRCGDRGELSVVLQNQSDDPLEVDVALRATHLSMSDAAGRRVLIPARDRRAVTFPVAAELPGAALVQVAARSGRWSDASEARIPVWTPAATEAFAIHGSITHGAVLQPVERPPDVYSEYGGLTLGTSSTEMQALTDAFIYLRDYPHACVEQRSSQILSVAGLWEVLAAFQAAGLPDSSELRLALTRDVYELALLQNPDGGFGLWQSNGESWPFPSVHAAHALARARSMGIEPSTSTWNRARRYLDQIESHIPVWYGPDARACVIAYALYTRWVTHDPDPRDALALIGEVGGVEGLPLEACGWLLPVLSADTRKPPQTAGWVEAIRRRIENSIQETAATAEVTTGRSEGDYLTFRSSRRTDALILEGLISSVPEHDLIPKLARGLLAHRKQGRWANTQENLWVLLALGHYFQAYESVNPDFTARAWLDGRLASEQRFAGRSAERHELTIPLTNLAEGVASEILISKEGAGRLYYRIGMACAPRDSDPPAVDRGFTVERRYEAVDDSTDVWRDADGRWCVRVGARVRVVLTMVAPARRYHVALEDRLPAGFEPLNPALALTGKLPSVGGREPRRHRSGGIERWVDRGWGRWYEHQNLRDDRAEAFQSLLSAGVYTYSYYARATTIGEFVAPPPQAEEMYEPETFGRGSAAVVVIEGR